MVIMVNDETVKTFLKKLSDYTLKEGDLAGLMQQSIHEGTNVTQGMVFDHLKTELLAQEVRLMLQAGIESFIPGSFTPPSNQLEGLATPSEMWSAYEKLNRRVTIEAFPLHVQDFVSQVKAEPKDAELLKLFEEGRTRLPHPAFDEPGFMQPHKVAFGYVKADFAPFLEAAKKEITDEQVAKAYEEGKAKGEFKVEEPPPPKPGEKPEEKPGEKPAEKPGEKPADPNAPKEPGETPKTGDKPATDKPATDKPATEKPATGKPTTDKPAGEEPKTDKPAAKPAEKPADKPADKKNSEPKKNEGSALSRELHLVNFQEDDKKKAGDKPADTKPTEAKPAGSKPTETKPGDKPAETKPTEAKPAETKPADPTAKPAETKPAPTDPADPAAKPEDKPAEPKEVKFKPLEEVQDEIRTTLARPIAADKRQKVVGEIIAAVNAYSRDFNRWKIYSQREQSSKTDKNDKSSKVESKKYEKPQPLDLSKVLEGTSLQLQEIPLVDQHEVQAEVDETDKDGVTKKVPKYEIAKSYLFDLSNFSVGGIRPFAEVAFAEKDNFYSPQTLPFPWENKQFMGGGGSEVWVYWRTDEVAAKERDFAAARKDVLQFWKEREALRLAQAAANDLAEKAGQGKDLKSLVAKPEEVITPPAFSWYTTGATGQFGGGGVSFGEVPGVKYPGQEFRQAVFDLQVGQAGAALDQPHRTVWVVKILGEDGITEADQARFMEEALDRDVLQVAWQSQFPLQNELYTELFKEYNVSWAPNKEAEEE
jgi:hypothetical protein